MCHVVEVFHGFVECGFAESDGVGVAEYKHFAAVVCDAVNQQLSFLFLSVVCAAVGFVGEDAIFQGCECLCDGGVVFEEGFGVVFARWYAVEEEYDDEWVGFLWGGV